MHKKILPKKDVFNLIGSRTRHNPVKSEDIEKRFLISGPDVREIIRDLRRSGEPIVATQKGYYVAKDKEDVDVIVNDLTKRIASMGKTLRELERKVYDRLGYQITFPGFGCDRIQLFAKDHPGEIHRDSQKEGASEGMRPVQDNSKEDGHGELAYVGEDLSLGGLL